MNNNDDNRVRPINRVATPIKLDESGQRIESEDNPIILTKEEKEERLQNKKIEEKNRKIEEHDPSTAIFVVILLIIFAILAAFICLYIVPRYIDSKKYRVEYNDAPKSTTTTKKSYPISTYTLVDSVYVNNASVYNVNNFKIELEYNGTNFNLIVNGAMVTKMDYVLPKVGIVDDILLIAVQNEGIRSTTLYALDEAGVLVSEWHQLGDYDGMVLLPDSSSIIFNRVNFVLLGSRVNNNLLMLHTGDTLENGINICGTDSLINHNIDETFVVLGSFNIEYLGNHEFSKPRLMYSTSLSDYKTINNLCK